MSMTLAELAERIGATLRPARADEASRRVVGCARLEEAGAEDVTFLANPRYNSQLATTRAAAVIVAPDVATEGRNLLVADDPYFAFRNAVVALHPPRRHPHVTDGPWSPLAVIHRSAKVGPDTHVHPYAVISEGAEVGAGCELYPHVFIGPGAKVGDGCVLHPNVTVYDGCVLGNRVIVHAGCVIGQDGFGFATHGGLHHKIPQVGNVVIGDDVEMGANCTVDRATLGSTVIGEGSKFSDLVAVGHGAHIGRHNLLVALVGIAGSAETGDYVAMGGQAGWPAT
jgi:UDP-3-O-[3-hydroxymyristoyl] glucosamine N-acyltransferase